MAPNLKVEDKLDGAINFKYWKTKILLILEGNELQDHVEKFIPEPKPTGVEEKAKYKNNEATWREYW